MDHTSGYLSSAHATNSYQPVPDQDAQDHGEEERRQSDLGDPISSEPDTSENENADALDGEMPRMKRHGLDLAIILGDVAAVASPVAFIVFAVMVLCLDGSEASETSFAKWNNATTVLGTLFPIVFASTVGRFVYEVARWKLEQGVTLGTLEQLLGSQTVGSTVLTHAKLCFMNPLAAGLLFIWIFSPLGGQSLLRILSSRLEPVVQNSTIVHFDSDAASMLAHPSPTTEDGGSASEELMRYLGNWYSALLLAPLTIKTDGMDLWGNVKVPFLSEESNHSNWSQVSWSPDPEYFSSLAGYPVSNVSMGNSTFSMQTSYLQLNCSKQQRRAWDFVYNMTSLENFFEWDNVTYQNGTIYGARDWTGTSTAWNFGVDRFVDPFWLNTSLLSERLDWGRPYTTAFRRPFIFENETGIESRPGNLFFDSQIITGGRGEQVPFYTVAAECEMKQKYIESRVSCSRSSTTPQNCTVVAQRPSRRRHAPEDISQLSFPSTLHWVSWGLSGAAGTTNTGKADLSVQYLTDSKSGYTTKAITLGAFEKLSDALFSRRLSQLFNTYLVLSQTDMGSVGTVDGMRFFSENVTVPAQVSNLVQKYTISKPWITLCFVSCIVLLCGGVLSVVFAHFADGPEILGYASTAVRDSKFLELLPEVGSMAAIDITKMMRGERLRYGITHLTRKGQRLLGVGREAETEQIKERFN
ncbi:hypothetical protein BHE90_002162 [Fusarium euwallaceae]|uniref:Uncharacterized protein n=1 Tax=Fusarium euwallaceae TaxID=1147111 RepID=A0A430M5T5_9HYPO|nr:hypothetical protein BHE90_002162 [Fusarium euwallaceae]